LPIDYEGRVVAILCEDANQTMETTIKAPELEEPISAKPAEQDAQPKPPEASPVPSEVEADLCQGLFFDLPGDTDFLHGFQPAATVATEPKEAPDLSLSASLRSAFQEDPGNDDQPDEENSKPPELSQASEPNPCALPEPTQKTNEIDAYFDPECRDVARPAPTSLMASDEDDWAVYLAPQPTLQSHRPVPQVIEIMTPPPEPAPSPTPFDPAIDLVLAGEEKQTFSLMAQEVVETVESFETLKKIDAPESDPPLLIAELRKLDPNMPDKRPYTLLPWIKRDETEDEMVERLTIKSRCHAS